MQLKELIENVQKYHKNPTLITLSKKLSFVYLTRVYNGNEHDYVLRKYHGLLWQEFLLYFMEKEGKHRSNDLEIDIDETLERIKNTMKTWKELVFSCWLLQRKSNHPLINYLNTFSFDEEDIVREELGLC